MKKPKPKVFRLDDNLVGVMIVPDVIEVYLIEHEPLDEYVRLCHVEWKNRQLWVPQSGLPREQLEAIFEKQPMNKPPFRIFRDGKPLAATSTHGETDE